MMHEWPLTSQTKSSRSNCFQHSQFEPNIELLPAISCKILRVILQSRVGNRFQECLWNDCPCISALCTESTTSAPRLSTEGRHGCIFFLPTICISRRSTWTTAVVLVISPTSAAWVKKIRANNHTFWAVCRVTQGRTLCLGRRNTRSALLIQTLRVAKSLQVLEVSFDLTVSWIFQMKPSDYFCRTQCHRATMLARTARNHPVFLTWPQP